MNENLKNSEPVKGIWKQSIYLFKPLMMYILFSNGHLVCTKAKYNFYFLVGKLEYKLDESSVGGIDFWCFAFNSE